MRQLAYHVENIRDLGYGIVPSRSGTEEIALSLPDDLERKREEVSIEVTVNDERIVFREALPDGFPSELIPHLQDFWHRGFAAYLERRNATQTVVQSEGEVTDVSELAPPSSGRPASDDVYDQGQRADALKAKGFTYGQIAAKICPERVNRHHRCNKKCADRIRQQAESYRRRKYLEDLSRDPSESD